MSEFQGRVLEPWEGGRLVHNKEREDVGMSEDDGDSMMTCKREDTGGSITKYQFLFEGMVRVIVDLS